MGDSYYERSLIVASIAFQKQLHHDLAHLRGHHSITQSHYLAVQLAAFLCSVLVECHTAAEVALHSCD